ncbi:gliding motility-associated peptidyl-prolyl isomerase GldI [Flavobacterium sp. ACAM 123]|jgi:gliding motility-associated peptidyl-prolyl isomerase|uniref:gliding motility-associated peptidyl-prolyl isomerase GldI n=1 Tax=Flavobacterium sp. ACAM 123 TaxID=1189620 RepID=UPI0002EC103F|nr:gliding motility-associated peptidyl-prolyl isomerase GldI [Flavobacterium sp. ACAM 123]
MKFSSIIAIALFISLIFSGCKQHQEARRPISQTSGSFMKKSVERNKKLVAVEEDQIKKLMQSNPEVDYMASSKGYWYSYESENEVDTLTPKKGDVVFFDYEIKDLSGAIIYSELELRPQIYYVDKQNIMMGLRDGIKLMHKNEKVNFLFPSHIGFGYHGDNKRIGHNQPLICTVTLRDFMSEANYNKQIETKSTPALTAVKKVMPDSTPQVPTPIKKPNPTPIQAKDTLK